MEALNFTPDTNLVIIGALIVGVIMVVGIYNTVVKPAIFK